MKKLFFILCLSPLLTFAQKTYTVGPKETLFSIGRTLNIHPRELAEYNNISLETGVKVGQVLKIPAVKKMAPLTDAPPAATTTPTVNNTPKPADKPAVTPTPAVKPTTPAPVKPATTPAVQNNKPAVAADMVPVYHKVEKKETLFQIAQHTNASIDDIKKWNKLTVDGVNEGANLIVGYKKRGTEPAVKKEEAKTVTTPVENKPVEKVTAPVVETEIKTQTGIVRNYGGGFFKVAYASQNAGNTASNNENGIAAVFKSTSGWTDGKYYCLHNTAPAGTIVKITSKSNQKFVYAKVLDVIPDLKQNEGLLIRLSNAAADELGISADVFDVQLTY